MIPQFPNDRDYFFGKDGNIYQVIGFVHPEDRIYCLQKYTILTESDKSLPNFAWSSYLTGKKYKRQIPSYSSINATSNIENSTFAKLSPLYGVNFIQYPKEKIQEYLNPINRLQNMREHVQNTFLELSDQERSAIEISYIFEEELGIFSRYLGVTGSILWKGVHPQSDIDLIIYGIPNVHKFFKGIEKLRIVQENFTIPSLTEKLIWAGKFSQKSGLSVEDCTVFISNKKFLLNYSKFFLSIAFNPTPQEISQNTLATQNTRFINLPGWESVIIRAKVKEDEWVYFYPGVLYLENVEFLSIKENSENPPSICRVLIFEHENVGYYKKGDLIEIRGLVQTIENPPEDVITHGFSEYGKSEIYGQVVVGTYDNYGAEYIKNLNL